MLLICAATLFAALLPAGGCGSDQQPGFNPADYAGTYLGTETPGSSLTLNPDGTFHLKDGSLDINGTFDVSNGALTLTANAEFQRPPTQGKIEGNRILDPAGTSWYKEGTAPTASGTAPTQTAPHPPPVP